MTNDELDRAVAIEVMGWEEHHVEQHVICEWIQPGPKPPAGEWPAETRYIHDTMEETRFSPSTCWRSAGAVVERLREGGMRIELCWDDEGVRLTAYSPAPGTGGAWTFGGGDPDDPILRRLAFAALAAARAGALEAAEKARKP